MKSCPTPLFLPFCFMLLPVLLLGCSGLDVSPLPQAPTLSVRERKREGVVKKSPHISGRVFILKNLLFMHFKCNLKLNCYYFS